jgi:hypothetical protein
LHPTGKLFFSLFLPKATFFTSLVFAACLLFYRSLDLNPYLPSDIFSFVSRYAEKQVGYVACGVFLNEKDELLRLVINSVRNDLISRNEAFQCLALEFVANGRLIY